jgi:hypothetical protein
MAKALKNEVALDFLENLKMGERVIKENCATLFSDSFV